MSHSPKTTPRAGGGIDDETRAHVLIIRLWAAILRFSIELDMSGIANRLPAPLVLPIDTLLASLSKVEPELDWLVGVELSNDVPDDATAALAALMASRLRKKDAPS